MTQAIQLVGQLKAEFVSHAMTAAEFAKRMSVSEASVTRMFAQRNMTLKRVDTMLPATAFNSANWPRSLIANESAETSCSTA